ncbi:MAG: anti-sigma factor family protein [Pyrinomonadaceae bacterium]
MKGPVEQNELMIRYLLGELPAGEQARVEDEYFARDEAFEQLLAVEDELIDAYVSGELPARQRARFEAHFLSTPRRRERVAFARELWRASARVSAAEPAHVPPSPGLQQKTSWWQSLFVPSVARRPALSLALAVVVAVLVSGGVWLIFERNARHDQLAAEPAARPQSEPPTQQTTAGQNTPPVTEQANGNAPLTGPAPTSGLTIGGQRGSVQPTERTAQSRPRPSAAPPAARPTIITLALSPGLVRGSDEPAVSPSLPANSLTPNAPTGDSTNVLLLPRGADFVQLRLDFNTEQRFKSYRVTLATVEGRELFNRRALKAQPSRRGAKAISFRLPASLLDSGDYLISLSGLDAENHLQAVADYYFKVEKK